jgi:hypothetical protein
MDWQAEAIKRLSLPKTLREGTNRDFHTKHNIPESTYYEFVSRPESQKKILALTLGRAKEETPEILVKLVEMAKNGDMRAIDIYIQHVLQLAKILDLQSGGQPIPLFDYVQNKVDAKSI